MRNIQERFGRPGKDRPTLIPELKIIGRRVIEDPVCDMIPAHSLKNYQFIYVEKGEMEIWVNGAFYTVHEKQLIIIEPYEPMAYLSGILPRGTQSFIQVDTYEKKAGIKAELIAELAECLKLRASKTVTAGELFEGPFHEILEEHRNQKLHSCERASGYFEILVINLIRLISEQFKESSSSIHEPDLLTAIDDYITANLDQNITVFDLARVSGFSENYFRVLFKKIKGISPLNYLTVKKIDTARELLMNSDSTITEIAFDLGYSSSQYFATFFKKQTSLTPEEFRRETRTLMSKNVKKIVSAADAAAQMDSHFHML